MALTNGVNLGLLAFGLAGDEHYDEIIKQWRGLDVLVQCNVIDRDLNAPPGTPADGDAYIVGPSPTGGWSTHAGKIARWTTLFNDWEFFTPRAGWQAHVVDEAVNLTFVASAWQQREAPMLVGVNNQAGTTYTFALADARGRVTRFTSGSAVTATVPLNSAVAFPVGSVITLRQVGAGEVTLTPTSGATINTPTGFQAKTARQGSTLMLHKVGTDEWDLTGDVKAA